MLWRSWRPLNVNSVPQRSLSLRVLVVLLRLAVDGRTSLRVRLAIIHHRQPAALAVELEHGGVGAALDLDLAVALGRRLVLEAERLEEIARMLGGVKITAQSRAHASEMIASRDR